MKRKKPISILTNGSLNANYISHILTYVATSAALIKEDAIWLGIYQHKNNFILKKKA